MRVRLRPGRGTEEEEHSFYAHRYPHGYDHRVWPDHVERVAASVAFIIRTWNGAPDAVVADLSCGDGSIAGRVADLTGARPFLGDLVDSGQADAVGGLATVGPLEQTIPLIGLRGPAGLYVCSETLEHLDDPDAVLRQLRPLTKSLFVSTPLGETAQDNVEHYWGWDQDGVFDMLTDAGFTPQSFERFTPESVQHYTFQFWMCT